VSDHDFWEKHAGWWQDGFTGGVDAEYEEQILPLTAECLEGARRVLDVGCGEGVWRKPLQTLRRGVDYLGLDGSEYAVVRYGRSRNIRLATFGQLGELRFDTAFDLIVCSDVLHYVPTPELKRGLSGITDMLDGVAFLELFTSQDAPAGDKHGFIPRSAKWYRSVFAQAGLIACGTHCYIGPRLKGCVAALESIDRD